MWVWRCVWLAGWLHALGWVVPGGPVPARLPSGPIMSTPMHRAASYRLGQGYKGWKELISAGAIRIDFIDCFHVRVSVSGVVVRRTLRSPGRRGGAGRSGTGSQNKRHGM